MIKIDTTDKKITKGSKKEEGLSLVHVILWVTLFLIVLILVVSKLAGHNSNVWSYTKKGIQKGEVTVQVGDYIIYHPEETATYNTVTSRKADNGYANQKFDLSSYTARMESIRN